MNLKCVKSYALVVLLACLAMVLLLSPPGKTSPVANLYDEVALYRPIEARLSIDQQYSPCAMLDEHPGRVPMADCADSLATLSPRALRGAGADPRATGLVFLVLYDKSSGLERAINSLDLAYRQETANPERANDLAAALAERAGRLNQPVDLVAALELIETALKSHPRVPWLLFNRALLLEKLQLPTLARDAWRRFLDVEPDSPWAAEARIHVAKLGTHARIGARPISDLLLRATQAEDPLQLVELARGNPREAREFALEVALIRWSEATLADHPMEAGKWASSVRILGEVLAEAGGDRSALETMNEIAPAPSNGRNRKFAIALEQYGIGHQLYRRRDYHGAQPFLSRAVALLKSIGRQASPLARWVQLDLGAIELHNNANEGVLSVLSPVLADCNLEKYPSLCARTAWALGLARFRLGRLADALSLYQTAAEGFRISGEKDNLAAVSGLMAEALRELGDTPASWLYRYSGMQTLSGQTRHRSGHNLLWEAGNAALEEGYPLAAGLFADEDVRLFGSGEDRLLALEAYFRRALYRRGRAPLRQMVDDLNRAEEISRELPPSELQPKIEAEVRLLLAQLPDEPPEQAEEFITKSLTFFRQHKLALREAAALLARARARKASEKLTQAEEDLESALALFEAQRDQIPQGDDRRLYVETWQGVYDDLIQLVASRGDAPEALRLLEKSRGSMFSDDLGRLGSTVVLSYAVTTEAFFRFEVKQGSITMNRFPLDRITLARSIDRFVESLFYPVHAEREAEEISHLLLPADLEPGSRLCIVPDQELAGIPFNALPMQGDAGPLVLGHEVVLAGSVEDCVDAGISLDFEHLPGDILLVGPPQLDKEEFPWLPELEGAAEEINDIQNFYPTSILLARRQVTLSRMLEELPKASVLHFAGHSIAHPTEPGRSFIPLWTDVPRSMGSARLSAADIAQLHLPDLKLAVLSACDTFRPQSRRTEAISGLVGAILDAGAQAAVGTLWKVGDAASRELLVQFHRNLRSGETIASALRNAQIRLIREDRAVASQEPAWAAFELVVRHH
jgi:tetratricopeptide (TPR) repeat protein